MRIPETNLAKFVLPSIIFDHFSVVDLNSEEPEGPIHIYLNELLIAPKDGHHYNSKGFTDATVINDFPIRGRSVFLHVRRRKWIDLESGSIVTTKIDLTHEGTLISKEFAAFLKGEDRK